MRLYILGFFTSILDSFEWKHIAIIFDNHDVLMRVQGEAIRQALREDERYPRPYDIEFSTAHNPNFKSMIEEARQYARGNVHSSSF